MPLPEVDRVIFGENPLKQVICQLRFPKILRIDTERPAQFQEAVRREFPHFQEDPDRSSLPLPDGVSELIPKELLQSLSRTQNRRFQFVSRDKTWIISLTKDFVALETSNYVRWEGFREKVELVLRALANVYNPTHFIRIGLRYRNVIDRKVLKLDDVPWRDLLSSRIAGPLGAHEIVDDVFEHHGTFLVQLDGGMDVVRVQHGLATDEAVDTHYLVYLLDHDFFTKKDVDTEVSDVVRRFDLYNLQNRWLFSWCIKSKLFNAMDPGPV